MGFKTSSSGRKRAPAVKSLLAPDDVSQKQQQSLCIKLPCHSIKCSLCADCPTKQKRLGLPQCRNTLTRYMRVYTSGSRYKPDEPRNYVLVLPSTNEGSSKRSRYFTSENSKLPSDSSAPSAGKQARSLADLMAIRALHGRMLRVLGLGTAVGFRTRNSVMTDRPAIIVFVARKLHAQWLLEGQMLPTMLQGPGDLWCDVDVVEFSYHAAPAPIPREQVYSELCECLRGNDEHIGSGSQVANLDVYGTMGAIVRSTFGRRQVGFITNRHIAVDLDHPYQKLYHPLPPNLGPGVYLGSVERASSFIADEIWYGMFAASCEETSVRADGAFIPFSSSVDCASITTSIKGIGEIGELVRIDLDEPIENLVGRKVIKVGRSSGLTKGTIIAYAVEYHDDKGYCLFTDLLVVGEGGQEFDMEGDSGSMLLLCSESTGEKPRPLGMIWGGTSNRGRLKLRNGYEPENWTSGVDLGRLLNLLEVDIITDDLALEDAWIEQHQSSGGSEESDRSPIELKQEVEVAGPSSATLFEPSSMKEETGPEGPISEEQLVALRMSPFKRSRMSM